LELVCHEDRIRGFKGWKKLKVKGYGFFLNLNLEPLTQDLRSLESILHESTMITSKKSKNDFFSEGKGFPSPFT